MTKASRRREREGKRKERKGKEKEVGKCSQLPGRGVNLSITFRNTPTGKEGREGGSTRQPKEPES